MTSGILLESTMSVSMEIQGYMKMKGFNQGKAMMAIFHGPIAGITTRLYQSYSVVLELHIIATSVTFYNKAIEIKLENASFHFNLIS